MSYVVTYISQRQLSLDTVGSTHWLDRHGLCMSKVSRKGIAVSSYMIVRYPMLLTYPFDARAQSWQMTMVHRWEQVMLNLVIQTTTKVVAKEVAIAKILRCDNLVLVKVGTGGMSTCL